MTQWLAYSEKFSNTTPREQYLIIASGLVAIIFILYSLFLDEPFQRIGQLEQQILQTQESNKNNKISIQVLEQALLEDPKADPIKHTHEDYIWISEITDAALQDNGISIQTMVSPTMYAGIANVYWFGTPLTRIHQEADKSPFKGRFAGAGRMLERIPLIGKRLKKRRLEKSLQVIEGEDFAES